MNLPLVHLAFGMIIEEPFTGAEVTLAASGQGNALFTCDFLCKGDHLGRRLIGATSLSSPFSISTTPATLVE